MAKDKNAEEPRAISLETIEMIEGQVKKGKARKFFLIYKGATIKSLVVFKKGPFGPKVLKAKKDGFKGEVAYGVVTGSGKNLFFQLPGTGDVAGAMKVDGFMEKPPTKKAKLREFLADNGLKFKPSYHVITELGDAPDPESENDLELPPPPPNSEVGEDENEGGSNLESQASTEAPSAPPEPPPAPTDAALAFTQKLKSLKPDMATVIGGNVSVSAEVKLKASEMGVFAKKKEFEPAINLLNEIEPLVKRGLAELGGASTEELDSNENAIADFKKRFAEIAGKIKALVGTTAGNEAKLKASEAAALSKQGDLIGASSLLDEAEELLANASEATSAEGSAPAPDSSQAPPERPTGEKSAKELATDLGEIRGRIDELLTQMPDAKSKLYQPLSAIAAQIKSGDLTAASQALAELQTSTDDLVERVAATTKRLNSIAESLADGQAFAPDVYGKLTAALGIAQESFLAGDLDRVSSVLERLEPRVKEELANLPQSDTERLDIREGIVAEQREKLEKLFESRISEDKTAAQGEVKKLESAVGDMDADPDPAGLAKAIQQVLDELYDSTHQKLMDSLKAESTEQVLKVIKEERQSIEGNELVQHLRSAGSDVNAGVSVYERFSTLFDDAESQVQEIAST